MDHDDRPAPFSPDQLDAGALPATTDSLRAVLARHRTRQYRVLGAAMVVVLCAGAAAGFTIGRGGQTSSPIAARAVPPASTASAAAGPMAAGGSGANVGAASPAMPVAPTSVQLLLRNAVDGTRVRLYENDLSAKFGCAGAQPCPAPAAMPSCFPTQILTAEVSDDQVAGSTGGPSWATPAATGFDPMSASTVGLGEPQPIVVAIAHAGAGVARVTLTTAYGSDTQVPSPGGWVALAVRLPATFTASSARPDLPDGTLAAVGPTGATVATVKLVDAGAKSAPPACEPCAVKGAPPAPSSGATPATASAAPGPCPSCTVTSGAPTSKSSGNQTGTVSPGPPTGPPTGPGGQGVAAPSGGASAGGAPPAADAPPPPATVCSSGGGVSGSTGSGSAASGSGSASSGSTGPGSVVSPPATATP